MMLTKTLSRVKSVEQHRTDLSKILSCCWHMLLTEQGARLLCVTAQLLTWASICGVQALPLQSWSGFVRFFWCFFFLSMKLLKLKNDAAPRLVASRRLSGAQGVYQLCAPVLRHTGSLSEEAGLSPVPYSTQKWHLDCKYYMLL